MLDEALIDDINDNIGTVEKKFSSNFSKAKAKFCRNLHYNNENEYLSTKFKSISLKQIIKMSNFSNQFFLGCICNKFDMLNLENYL